MEEAATLCRPRMCLGCVLLCRNSHMKVAEVSPMFSRITQKTGKSKIKILKPFLTAA